MFLTKSSAQKLKRLAKIIKSTNPKESELITKLLKEGMPSIRKVALSEIEGYLSTALQKYFQIMMLPNSTYINHWTSPLKSALKNVIKANSSKWASGYILTKEEIRELFDEVKRESFEEAFRHLSRSKLDYQTMKEQVFNQTLSLEDLFEYVGVNLPKWEKY